MNLKKKIIFIVGSTATGKSDWALRLAQEFKGVIVNCDSVQAYEKVEIGAAKASAAERALVPHYLIDYVKPPSESTAGEYSRDFQECLKTISDSTPVFVVGGTGFYFMAIEKGMYPVEKIAPELQKQILTEFAQPGGPAKLYQELLDKDPVYGAKIAPADHYRIGRALELIRTHSKSVTDIQVEFASKRTEFPHSLLKIGVEWEREVLLERIRERVAMMLDQGLIAEVQSLLAEGLAEWAPLNSVGYRETKAYLNGDITQAELLEQIVINTRQLAKKQKTWFKRDQDIHWCKGDSGFPEARALVEKFLAT